MGDDGIPAGLVALNIRFSTWRIAAGSESILAEPLPDGTFRLDRSPGWIPGLAAGDIFKPDNGRLGYTLISRSGNLSIWLFIPDSEFLAVETMIDALVRGTHSHGKLRFDGCTHGNPTLLVYSAPVTIGFKEIERIFDTIKASFTGMEWYFGNVYDDQDGTTPLNWWRKTDPWWRRILPSR
jgi:hypothetical protein